MSISSMTGFAAARGEEASYAWGWEIKSVNAKGLDVRCRLPSGFENLDGPVRERIRNRIKRGNLALTLTLRREQSEGAFQVNRGALDRVFQLLEEIGQRLPDSRPPSADGLLALKGVLEPADETLDEEGRAALEAAVMDGLETALASLEEMRESEGERLAEVLEGQIGEIQRLCGEAGGLAAMQPGAIRERLKDQVGELIEAVPALPEERLAQEAALLMVKADVREELDRLMAHVAAARELLEHGKAVGRRLDFLCQEFNREANTLCSKSIDIELTRLGLDLKAAVEQFREQVQNIE
ncbi:MAG: YicC/YloC family endoribonuclease [Rhodospirillales bacterium]